VTVIENGAVVDCAPIAVPKHVDNPKIVAATRSGFLINIFTIPHESYRTAWFGFHQLARLQWW
jgi:hypothetical protein